MLVNGSGTYKIKYAHMGVPQNTKRIDNFLYTFYLYGIRTKHKILNLFLHLFRKRFCYRVILLSVVPRLTPSTFVTKYISFQLCAWCGQISHGLRTRTLRFLLEYYHNYYIYLCAVVISLSLSSLSMMVIKYAYIEYFTC